MKEYNIYKPRKSNDGAATKINARVLTKTNSNGYTEEKLGFFWKSAKQNGVNANGNAIFDWGVGSAIDLKLSTIDMCKILSVLNGKVPTVQLYHKNKKGNTVLKIEAFKTDKGSGVNMRLSTQEGANAARAISHGFAVDEIIELRIFMEECVRQFYLFQE